MPERSRTSGVSDTSSPSESWCRLKRRPGVLVLHDLVLHHARLGAYLHGPEVLAYQDDLGNRDKRSAALKRLDAYRAEVIEAYPERGEEISEIGTLVTFHQFG